VEGPHQADQLTHVRVGILDQSPVRSGGTPADAVHETLELARAADRWGYHRYWLAEHHSTPGLAGASPEVLIAQVAAVTAHIRVGSGGVMLPHYSALKVAEQFRMLETLNPGRIDLGIGRAPGSDQRTARILRHGPGALGIEHYPRQIQDLVAFLHDDLPPEHPWRGVHAMPAGPSVPEVWLLGSSDESALLAAQLGQAFCFAHFINEQGGAEVTRAYRDRFCASPDLAAPRSSVAVFAVCAETCTSGCCGWPPTTRPTS
jgi:luciferase family oxidoreductase group 1